MNNKIKLLLYILIVFPCLSISSRSLAQTSDEFKNDYMPLAIGNKWYYNVHTSNTKVGSETSIITEIIGIDTIGGKKYFRIKSDKVSSKFPPNYYYQRISNDTLYTLNYAHMSNLYFERVTAIFTLDSGDIVRIELPPNELSSKNEAEGLPTGRNYSIKVTDKDENTIEFFTYSGMIDGEYTEIYQKGIGMIKSKGAWGSEWSLIKYNLND